MRGDGGYGFRGRHFHLLAIIHPDGNYFFVRNPKLNTNQ